MEKVYVIGGGASGVVAAIFSKTDNNEVTIIEKNPFLLKKLLITGAGRCNYFNENFNVDKFNIQNEIINNVISNKQNFLDFFSFIGIEPHIVDGYYYPYSNSSVSVQNALILEAKRKGIKFIFNEEVKSFKCINHQYLINESYIADKVVISTGSKAYPKTGSDGKFYNILSDLNISINDVLPALVQLKSNSKVCTKWPLLRIKSSLNLYIDNEFVTDSIGELQLTNYGISGICVLNISDYVVKAISDFKDTFVLINFLPFTNNASEYIINRFKNFSYRNIVESLEGVINYKLLIILLDYYKIKDDKFVSELNNYEIQKIIDIITKFKLSITDYNDFNNAQVCQGGVDLSEIDQSFMLKKFKNLYVTGEIIDIHGICGGFNLGFAFISAMICGREISKND